MGYTRRRLLARTAPLLLVSPLLVERAFGDTVTYQYDALGRVMRATYSGGITVLYTYDNAGNRTQVVRTDGSSFNATLPVTGDGANLRTVANNYGYSGITDATITFQVGTGVTINGGLDTGTWPSGTQSITLALQVSGNVYGAPGAPGLGTDLTTHPGGAGGDAIACHENISITVNSGGQVKGGGGGGGGGGAWNTQDAEGIWNEYLNGGNGGVAFPPSSGAGSAGTSEGGRSSGAGGAGGAAGGNGATGSAATGSTTSFLRKVIPSSGGAAGWAIRKNGKTVPVTNNGTITGTVA